MKKTNNRKWLYVVAGVLVVAFVAVVAVSNLPGDVFQGKSVKGGKKPKVEDCLEMYELKNSQGTSALSAWMTNNRFASNSAEYCRDNVIGYKRWFAGHPNQSECNDMYYYLKANDTSALSTWMQSNAYSQSDAEYCQTTYFQMDWFYPREYECWDLYEYLVMNGTTALSTWMQNTGWTSKPQYNLAEVEYCRDQVVGTTKWYSQTPTNQQCITMYNIKNLQDTKSLSNWMFNNGFDQIDSEYCRDDVIGRNHWFAGHPTKQECIDMYNYKQANGTGALTAWMQNEGYSQLDAEFCVNEMYGNAWY